MRCRKILLTITKSPEEVIPTEIFDHELRIVQQLFGDAIQVLGRVVDGDGKPVLGECGTPEEEYGRLRAIYSWVDEHQTVNAAELAYSNDTERLRVAMREGVSDELLEELSLSVSDRDHEGVARVRAEKPAVVKDPFASKETLAKLLDHMGIAYDRKASRFRLDRAFTNALEERAEGCGVDTDAVRSNADLLALLPKIEAAEAAMAERKARGSAAAA